VSVEAGKEESLENDENDGSRRTGIHRKIETEKAKFQKKIVPHHARDRGAAV
jgi:hypothetical protein